jgi:hypothetical protein
MIKTQISALVKCQNHHKLSHVQQYSTLHILGFVSPCTIIHSYKSTNRMHQSLRFITRRLNIAQNVENEDVRNILSCI